MIKVTILDNLKKVVDDLLENESDMLAKQDTIEKSNLYRRLGSNAYFYAIHSYYVERNIEKAKDFFNLHGKYKLISSQLSKAESFIRIFEVGRTIICNVGISDNEELIETYAKHNYPINYESRGKNISTDFKTVVSEGDDCIYSELMLNAIEKNIKKLELNIEIFKSKTLKKKKNEKMIIDLHFYEGLILGDKTKVENSIKVFLSKKEHKYRNQHDLFPELISYPAVGYIKMALLNGLNIDINHDFVPMDLLQSKPLDIYSNII